MRSVGDLCMAVSTQHDCLLLRKPLLVQAGSLHCFRCSQYPRLQLGMGRVSGNAVRWGTVTRLDGRKPDDVRCLPVHNPWSQAVGRQRLEHGCIYTGWANSDRQMADGLTKPQAAWKLLEIMSAGKWKIVWDATFQKARKLKVAGRSEGKRDFDG